MDNGEKDLLKGTGNKESDFSLYQLIKKLHHEKVPKEDVQKFESYVREHPQLLKTFVLLDKIDKSITNTNGVRSFPLAIREGALQHWRELRGNNPSPLEEMIIDQIVICWANLSDIQFAYQSQVGKPELL